MSDMRLLIVDDNRDIVTLFAAHFQTLGIQVECSFDGLEGIQKARAWHPDVVLLDFEMPVMSGEEFIAAAQSEGITSKFVLLTGSTLNQVSFDVDAILQKPISMDALEQTLFELTAE